MTLVPELPWHQKFMLGVVNQGIVLAVVGWHAWLWIFGIQLVAGFGLGVLFAAFGTVKYRVRGD